MVKLATGRTRAFYTCAQRHPGRDTNNDMHNDEGRCSRDALLVRKSMFIDFEYLIAEQWRAGGGRRSGEFCIAQPLRKRQRLVEAGFFEDRIPWRLDHRIVATRTVSRKQPALCRPRNQRPDRAADAGALSVRCDRAAAVGGAHHGGNQ